MVLMLEPVWLDEDRREERPALASWPRVLWVDPGGATGWSVVWFDDDVVFDRQKSIVRAAVAWRAGVFLGPENGHIDALLGLLRNADVGGDGLCIGVEDFVLGSALSDRSLLAPVRVTAKLEYALYRGVREADGKVRRRTLPTQSPVDAKRTITDARLKMWDMYLPGPDHPRDATRHALLWLRRLREAGEDAYDTLHFVDPEPDLRTVGVRGTAFRKVMAGN